MYLFAAATETVFGVDEASSALAAIDDKMFWRGSAQVEIMRLATARWQDFGAAERENLEARIRSGLPSELFPPEAFTDENNWAMAKDAAAYRRFTRLKRVGWPLSVASQAALVEIEARHPKWTPGVGDRDDFSVWHETRWGPSGGPELLAEVRDDTLVSEAMRVQRERWHDQGDIWRVLIEADPERALRGLKSDSDSDRFEPVEWRDLLWAASDKGNAPLQFEVADALSNMPAATLGELFAPAASWLQRRRESLKSDPPDEATFLQVWDRLAVLAYP
jgi:hypothetical protein